MARIVKLSRSLQKSTPLASRVIRDYEYWLNRKYGQTTTYLTNAKTFLKSYKQGGTVLSQLESYREDKGFTMRSILKRFALFLDEKSIDFVINDLIEKKLPKGNIYVKLFLVSNGDRLTGEKSKSTYATVLNQYFDLIEYDLKSFNKTTATKFINSPTLSVFSKQLYKAVLKSFCLWAIQYQEASNIDLSVDQRKVKKGLKLISQFSLREVSAIRVKSNKRDTNTYHKDSLTLKQRDKLLSKADDPKSKAILNLMSINGLRSIEICRLSLADCKIKERRIKVWGKGRPKKSKDEIKLFKPCRAALKDYIETYSIRNGLLFPGLTTDKLSKLVNEHLAKMKLSGKLTPHSLRHTAGQIMYDKGVPLEFIQKTLRHSDMRTTLVYAQKAIDNAYFRKMPDSF